MSIRKSSPVNSSDKLNICGSPIDRISEDKITNSSSSSISTYIKMLSNHNGNKPINKYINKYDKNCKSNIKLKSIQLSFSRNKANNPSENPNCYKTSAELMNNPYISKAILNKMNEIIVENSPEAIELKKKLFQKTIANLNEQSKSQSENKKNEIIKMLTQDYQKSTTQITHLKSATSSTTNQSNQNLHPNRSSSVIKVAQMKQMLDKVFDASNNYNNQQMNNIISNTNINIIKVNNPFGGSNVNGIKSRLLLTYYSSKDFLRQKRQEEKNDVDLFKKQLDVRKEYKLTNHSSFPNQIVYLKNYQKEKS